MLHTCIPELLYVFKLILGNKYFIFLGAHNRTRSFISIKKRVHYTHLITGDAASASCILTMIYLKVITLGRMACVNDNYALV